MTDRRSRLSLQARVRVHRASIDRELAAGRFPAREESVMRASQLADPAGRRRVARSIRRLADYAIAPPSMVLTSTAPINRAEIRRCREGLLGIAERLEREGPVNPCGVARAVVLLGDGDGPVYCRSPERSLDDALWWIADGLQPCPPHAWDCPVIMKLDPDHVAWTCKRCGAIGISDDPSARPA